MKGLIGLDIEFCTDSSRLQNLVTFPHYVHSGHGHNGNNYPHNYACNFCLTENLV